MSAYRTGGSCALRLALPLLLVFAVLAPRMAQLPAGIVLEAGRVLAGGPEAPIRFHRPGDGALFILPGTASLRQSDADRKFDDKDRYPDALRASPACFALRWLAPSSGPAVRPAIAAIRQPYRSRAPPVPAAA